MEFSSLNWLAIIAAAIVSFISGFIWFGPKTFYPVWWKAMGKSDAEQPGTGQSMPLVFGSIMVGILIQSFVLAIVLNSLDPASVDAVSGAGVGLLLGIGFVAATSLSHRLMGGQGFKVWAIEVGNDIINFALMGAILGAWR